MKRTFSVKMVYRGPCLNAETPRIKLVEYPQGWWKVACTQGDSQQGFFFQDAGIALFDSSKEKGRERYTRFSDFIGRNLRNIV